MELNDEHECAATRAKLRDLEERYAAARRGPGPLSHARELSLRSIKNMIDQMRGEIARFESRSPARQA